MVTTPLSDSWVDAAGSYKTLISGKASALIDKSGHSKGYSQSVVNDQPPFLASGQSNIGTIKGDATSDHMLMDIMLGAAFTVFFVTDALSSYPGVYAVGGNDPTGASPAFLTNLNPGTGVQAMEFYYFPVPTFRKSFLAQPATGYHVFALTHNDAASSPKTRGYLDGVEVFNGDMMSVVGRKFTHLYTNSTLASFGAFNFATKVFYHSELPVYQVTSLSKSFFLSRRGRP